MSENTQRSPSSQEGHGVYQMDPWKDDRCRDFIALNTIQRLRSYHSDVTLPVDPVNSNRAKNLYLLPKAEPDERLCATEDGCAVDMARIVFFGPMAFVSKTSPGRRTASPHLTSHSSSRVSVHPSESSPRGSTLCEAKAAEMQDSDELRHKEECSNVSDGIIDPRNSGTVRQHEKGETFEVGATPLKKPTVEGGCVAASPQILARPSEGEVNCRDDTSCKKRNDYDNCVGTGVVKFSCEIVETIVAYYQSLLARGVVLDRFSSKDLAFSWWVLCRDMDVSILRNYQGSTRRDTMLISLRHFYYELLSNMQPKKSVTLERRDLPPVVSEPKVEEVDHDEAETMPQSSLHSRRRAPKQLKVDPDETKEEYDDEENEKKRVRSRLDPTRNSPPSIGTRTRRIVQSPIAEIGGGVTNSGSVAKASGGTTNTSGAAAQPKSFSKQTAETKEEADTSGPSTHPSIAPVGTEPRASATMGPPEAGLPSTSSAAGSAAGAKRSRPSRAACLEEIWRSTRSTRRRNTNLGDSIDTEDGPPTNEPHCQNSTTGCNAIVERIRERMENEPAYAALFSGVPHHGTSGAVGQWSWSMDEETVGGTEAVGVMHPSLVQLLRYRYVEPSAEPIPLQRFDEGDKTGEEHRKHCPLAACGSKPDPSLTNESPTYARGVVKMEPGTEKDLNNDTKVFNADIKEAQKNPSRTTLTYAQRCLLTWEASRLLSSQSTPARRRQTVEDESKARVESTRQAMSHRYYDYWKERQLD